MSLSARSNLFGDHYYTNDYETYHSYEWSDDHIKHESTGSVNMQTHHCQRSGGGSNPKTLIPGTSTLWRYPRAYSRGIFDVHHTPGEWTKPFSGGLSTTEFWRQYDTSDVFNLGPVPNAFWWGTYPGVNWSNELESMAIANALQSMKDQKVGLGEDLLTAKQTYSMLADSGMLLLRAALALKRGNIGQVWSLLKDGRSAVKQGANYYLQYKYGWKPLMSDIHGLTSLLKEQLKPALILKSYGKSGKEGLWWPSGWDYSNEGSGTRQAKCTLYAMPDGTYSRLGDRLGLSNPLSLAWEIVPFSFVVDWFIPVGSTLDGFLAPAGLTFISGSCTQQVTCENVTTRQPPSGLFGSPMVTKVKAFGVERKAYGDWPRPGFYTTNPFSSNHGLSAFALILQKLFR